MIIRVPLGPIKIGEPVVMDPVAQTVTVTRPDGTVEKIGYSLEPSPSGPYEIELDWVEV